MSKRWLGCVVLGIVGSASGAWANVTVDPSPVVVGNVVVNGNFTVNATASSDIVSPLSDTLDHFHPDDADPDCTLFTLTPGQTLPQNLDSATPLGFSVQFAPVATGAKACTVALHSLAHTPVGTAFDVEGTGTAPAITAPASASFPDARVTGGSSTADVIIQSTGTANLQITALNIPVGAGQFSIPSPPALPATIAPGNSLTVTVRFDPTGSGARTGTLAITSNDTADSPHQVALSGTGTNARIAVSDVAFGVVTIGQTATQPIAVTNNALAPVGPLTITGATITGGGGAITFADNGFGCGAASCTFGGGVLAPQNIEIRCTPPAGSTGTITATVTFASDTDSSGADPSAAVACTPGRADATVTPRPLAFGSVAVGTTVVKTATVTNSGTIDLTFTATKAGARQAEYTVSGCFTACVVPAGQNRTFDVSFTPALPRGNASITINVASNDPDNATIAHPVTATVTAPVITAPASQTFASRRVANATLLTASQGITIQNTGDATLEVTGLAITGGTDFSIPSPPALPTSLAPNATLVVTVVFDPSVAGLRTANLEIASTDPATATKSVALSGTGTTAVIAVSDVAFGIVNLGQTKTDTITVTNSSLNNPGPLTITSAAITGGDGWFTFDANGSGCLGQTSCTFGAGITAPQNIAVRCTPPAGSSGAMMATVSFASDSDGGGDNISSLLCTAGRADATVDPVALAYGDVDVGATVSKTVSVTNTGNITLTFTATKAGARQAEYTFSGCFSACAVLAGQTRTFDLAFTPTTRGAANITVSVASNDPDNATIAIPVTANAIAPVIQAAATLQFDNVEVVTTTSRTLTITNIGDADLVISTAAITTNDGSYAITSGNTGAQTVAPTATASWDLTCTPQTPGAHDGNFRITSNALGSATRNIALRCNGTEGVLVVIPTSINFNGVAENTTATRSYVLQNTGNLTVSNIAGVLDPANVGYTLDPATPFPASIAPGVANQVTLNIKFSPQPGVDGGPATVTFSGTWGTGAKPLRVPPVLSLNGDGLTTGFDVTPGTIAFGDLRFDSTLARTFCIVNTSQTSLTINTITIAPDVGTVTGEFTAPTIRRKTCGSAIVGLTQNLPQPLLPGEQLEVTVVANPADRSGALAATLTVTSSLNVNPTRTVTLTANATTATIVLDPATSIRDFGARDVQAAPTTENITITNSGQAPLDLGSFARSDNATNTHFTFTLPPTTTLQPGETLTIPVTYAPALVTVPDESIVLSHTIAGVLGAPANQMITIRGRGIDREIDLVAAKDFPATYRNPGTAAPIEKVLVKNLGEAPLRISASMVTSADPGVWTLQNPQPVLLAPTGTAGDSHEFSVRFTPTAIGMFTATLVVTNDDSSEPMAEAALRGTAGDRNIGFGAPTIDLGYTGIGIAVTIEGALQVANLNPTDAFTITRIGLDGDPGFAIVGSPENELLAPATNREFAVTFTPEASGDFTTTARLFVDMDGEDEGLVTITGHAVFVDAHGGGGCFTGSGLGGGALVIVALALAMRRRRRMLAVTALCVVLVPAARAEDNVVLSVFDPTPATTGTGFQLQSPDVGKPGDWVVSAIVSHATNPLVLTAFEANKAPTNQNVVERSTLVEIGAAYAFLDRFEIGARMPYYSQAGEPLGDRQTMFTMEPPKGTAAGDLTVHGKARLLKVDSGVLAASLQLTLPTASDGAFTGVDKPSGRLLVLGALNPNTLARRITLSANAGAVVRDRTHFANLEQGSGFAWGLGTSVRVLDRVWLGAEVFGDLVPSGQRSSEMASVTTLKPIEWLAGLRYFPDHRFSVAIAAGRGLTSSAGSPELRGVLALTFAPGAAEITPLYLPEPPRPDGDADADGIRDSVDRCPTEAEDADLFDDADGCPDLDNDGDSIVDAKDKCPLDAEDLDGFEDDDGCDDKDNDQDKIADKQDKCPLEPEDRDGHEDLDGCVDPDNDGDGIVDAKDKCPNELETINGSKDDDGCPDPGNSIIVLSPDRMETLDPIQFTSGTKLSRSSFNVLGQVAATMRAHPEIVRMRVTCHIHPSGDWQRDQELSDKRAQAVRDWLVQWGITASRVEARGFGASKPLAPNTQKGAQTINDRIELIILERK